MEQRRQRDWQVVRNFKDEATEVVVQVKRDMASKWPRFSFNVGREGREEGRLLSHLSWFFDKADGEVKLRHSIADAIAKLMKDAEEWVVEEVERAEQEFQARRQSSRPRVEDGPRQVMRKGKTQRERDRRANRRREKEGGL